MEVNKKLFYMKITRLLTTPNMLLNVCFNNFFSTVASSIGKDVNYDPLQHPSIVEIKRKMEIESEKSFVFQKVTEQKVETIVNNINIKKATGVDGIPAKVVKNCTEAIIPNLTLLINLSVEHCIFPDRLKQAQVTPLHKKNNPLELMKLGNNHFLICGGEGDFHCVRKKIYRTVLRQNIVFS